MLKIINVLLEGVNERVLDFNKIIAVLLEQGMLTPDEESVLLNLKIKFEKIIGHLNDAKVIVHSSPSYEAGQSSQPKG